MIVAVLSLVGTGLGFAVYGIALAAKHHLDPRARHEVAFVLALAAVAVTWGAAVLIAAFGGAA